MVATVLGVYTTDFVFINNIIVFFIIFFSFSFLMSD